MKSVARIFIGTILGIICGAIGLAAQSEETLVGSLPGEITVNNTGQASYSIPIDVVPGTSGMMPKLGFSYSSGNASAGLMGVGWSLDGLSAISRIGQNKIRDGKNQPVKFNAEDRFALDGQRLINVTTATYGATSGCEYRTEIESFSKVTTFGGTAGNPDYFEVKTKDGLIYYYGRDCSGDNSSKQSFVSVTTTWFLSRVTDSYGNYFEFYYNELNEYSSTNPQPKNNRNKLLRKINYTGNPNAGVAPYRSIVFQYEQKADGTDWEVGLYQNNYVINSKRLKAVYVTDLDPRGSILDSELSVYHIKYELNYGVSSASQRSILQSIQKKVRTTDASGAMKISVLPKTEFGYSGKEPDNALNLTGTTGAVFEDQYQSNTQFIDFDGDGIDEMLFEKMVRGSKIEIYKSTGVGFTLWKTLDPFYEYDGAPASEFLIADYNKDGLLDIFIKHPVTNGIEYYLYFLKNETNGDYSFIPKLSLSTAKSYVNQKVATGDFNGDGEIDISIIDYNKNGFDVRYYNLNPSLMGDAIWSSGGSSFPNNNTLGLANNPILSEDFSPKFSNHGTDRAESAGFVIAPNTPVKTFSIDDINVQVMDYDSDGRTDIGFYGLIDGSERFIVYRSELETSNGAPYFKLHRVVLINSGTADYSEKNNFYMLDLNGDGNSDILRIGKTNIVALFSNGDPTLTTNYLYNTNFLPWAGYGLDIENTRYLPGDYDRDGRLDIVVMRKDAVDLWKLKSQSRYLNNNDAWVVQSITPSSTAGYVTTDVSLHNQRTFMLANLSHDNAPDWVVNRLRMPAFKIRKGSIDDVLVSVKNGIEVTSRVEYDFLNAGGYYTKGTGSKYPILDVSMAMPVAVGYAADIGANDRKTVWSLYQYGNARLDVSGRGFLGFGTFISFDASSGLIKRDFVEQSYPMTGMLKYSETYLSRDMEDLTHAYVLTKEMNAVTFDAVSINGQKCGSWFPMTAESLKDNYTYESYPQEQSLFANRVVTMNWFDNQNINVAPYVDLPTTFLPAGYTQYSAAKADSSKVDSYKNRPFVGLETKAKWDSVLSQVPGNITHGNMTKIVVDYGDGNSQTVTNTYLDDESKWHLGRLKTATTVTEIPNSPTATKHAAFNYDATTGVLKDEIIYDKYPDSGSEYQIKTTYLRDSVGNVYEKEITTDATGTEFAFAPFSEFKHSGFDSKKRWPSTTENNVGDKETITYDDVWGYVKTKTGPNGSQTRWSYNAFGQVTREDRSDGTWSETKTESDANVTIGAEMLGGKHPSVPAADIMEIQSAYRVEKTGTQSPKVITYFDRLGRELSSKTRNFDDTNDIVKETVYDYLGRPIAGSEAHVSGASTAWTYTSYNRLSQQELVIMPNGKKMRHYSAGKFNIVEEITAEQSLYSVSELNAKGQVVKVYKSENKPVIKSGGAQSIISGSTLNTAAGSQSVFDSLSLSYWSNQALNNGIYAVGSTSAASASDLDEIKALYDLDIFSYNISNFANGVTLSGFENYEDYKQSLIALNGYTDEYLKILESFNIYNENSWHGYDKAFGYMDEYLADNRDTLLSYNEAISPDWIHQFLTVNMDNDQLEATISVGSSYNRLYSASIANIIERDNYRFFKPSDWQFFIADVFGPDLEITNSETAVYYESLQAISSRFCEINSWIHSDLLVYIDATTPDQYKQINDLWIKGSLNNCYNDYRFLLNFSDRSYSNLRHIYEDDDSVYRLEDLLVWISYLNRVLEFDSYLIQNEGAGFLWSEEKPIVISYRDHLEAILKIVVAHEYQGQMQEYGNLDLELFFIRTLGYGNTYLGNLFSYLPTWYQEMLIVADYNYTGYRYYDTAYLFPADAYYNIREAAYQSRIESSVGSNFATTVLGTDLAIEKAKIDALEASIMQLQGDLFVSNQYAGVKTALIAAFDSAPAVANLGTPELEYIYNAQGNVTKTIPHADTSRQITLNYDLRGNKTSMDDPDMGSWEYKYNALGQLRWQKDARGVETTMEYDNLGRMVKRIVNSQNAELAQVSMWTYYAGSIRPENGWIGALQREVLYKKGTGTAEIENQKGYYYDNLGRSFLTLYNLDAKWYYTYTRFDDYSRVKNVDYFWRPMGLEQNMDEDPYAWHNYGLTYTYNDQSFTTEIQDSNGKSWWGSPNYDAKGRLTNYRVGDPLNSVRSNVTYNPIDNTVQTIRSGFGGNETDGSIQDEAYSFDGYGNLKSRRHADKVETFQYDWRHRLSKINGVETATYDDFGNILSKRRNTNNTNDGLVTYDYVSAGHKNAVTNAFGYTMTYDANGNMITREGNGQTWSFSWEGFNKPEYIANGSECSQFIYDASQQHVVQVKWSMTVDGYADLERKVYVGGAMEQTYTRANISTAWKIEKTQIFITSPSGIVGIYEFSPQKEAAQQVKRSLLFRDHLGSVTAVSDFGGNNVQKLSFDAWGSRRSASDWSTLVSTTAASGITDRGFTGHEMLENLGLVHMNGRIYDPLLGKFLSADPFIQSPGNLQSYNRYSYVTNNPLSFTDPSGHFLKGIGNFFKKYWKMIVIAIIAIVLTIVTFGAFAAVAAGWGAAFGAVAVGGAVSLTAMGALVVGAMVGAVVGFATGFAGALLGGGGLKGAFKAGLKGAANGAISGAISGGTAMLSTVRLAAAMANGIGQGIASELMGGSFKEGFMSGFTGSMADCVKIISSRVINAAIVGGTMAELSGGKFVNGAISGAISEVGRMYNESQMDRKMTQEAGNKAKLSAGIYEKNYTGADAGYKIDGGINENPSGLKYAVFKKIGTGEKVMVFAGTEDWTDFGADLKQAYLGKTAQYEEAIALARNLNVDNFAGHSLGGGLAAACAIAVGGTATTFNAAGLNWRYNGTTAVAIDSYYSASDVLSILNYGTLSRVPGNVISVGYAGFHGSADIAGVAP
jgi:RHS repeat-associated protein